MQLEELAMNLALPLSNFVTLAKRMKLSEPQVANQYRGGGGDNAFQALITQEKVWLK